MFKIITYIICITLLLLITTLLVKSNEQKKSTKIFTFVVLCTLVWVILLWIADSTSNILLASTCINYAVFLFSVVTWSLLYFALRYNATNNIKDFYYLAIAILYNSFYLYAAATHKIVTSLDLNTYGASITKATELYSAHVIQANSFTILALLILNHRKRKFDLLYKKQVNLMTVGLVVAMSGNILSGVVASYLRGFDWLNPFGTLSTAIFISIIGYAIIKHKLFDIRLVVLRSLGYILTITAVSVLYGFLAFNLLTELLSQGDNVNMSLRVIYTLLAVSLAFVFNPIKRFFDKLTNKLFYQDAYDSQDLIDELNKSLVSTLDMATIQRSSMAVIDHYIKPDFISFALKATAYRPQLIAGTQHKISLTESVLTDPATADSTVKVILTDLLEESDKDLRAKLRAKDIAVLVRLTGTAGSEVIGAIALGAKRSGNPYTSQDIKVLEIAANTLAIAIQNALSFEEIQQFNLTLTQRVDDATHKLKRANARLVALDQNKDDFISMVSHQLRTPLTSIKGYASMLLDGDGGMPLNKSEQRFVQQILFSSQQMVAMIGDLLNLSRLNSGHFDMQRTPTDIVALVRDQIHQLKHIADQKEITIDFDYDKGMPLVTIDKDKMQQVVMNFIDNAVHYTPPKGEVVVNLSLSKRSLDLKVSDSGIGVPKSDQSKLFSRYFRANNAKKYRPSGTGIGLYMAKKVIISHGGAVIFRANPKGGSTFGFSLPLSQVITKPNKDKIDKKSSKTKEVELATAD